MSAIEDDPGWYERMARRARERRHRAVADGMRLVEHGMFSTVIPARLLADELPPGVEDVPREWCTMCGLADAPGGDHLSSPPPCPRCGSEWRWYGRIADLVAAKSGTVADPPDDECTLCYEWRRWPEGQGHFGWTWWPICDHGCRCEHHVDEVWFA